MHCISANAMQCGRVSVEQSNVNCILFRAFLYNFCYCSIYSHQSSVTLIADVFRYEITLLKVCKSNKLGFILVIMSD